MTLLTGTRSSPLTFSTLERWQHKSTTKIIPLLSCSLLQAIILTSSIFMMISVAVERFTAVFYPFSRLINIFGSSQFLNFRYYIVFSPSGSHSQQRSTSLASRRSACLSTSFPSSPSPSFSTSSSFWRPTLSGWRKEHGWTLLSSGLTLSTSSSMAGSGVSVLHTLYM